MSHVLNRSCGLIDRRGLVYPGKEVLPARKQAIPQENMFQFAPKRIFTMQNPTNVVNCEEMCNGDGPGARTFFRAFKRLYLKRCGS